MAFKTLNLTLDEGIATVALNGGKLNAITQEMRREFRDLAEELFANDAIKVVIFTGQGKAFSAGADIGLFEKDWDTRAFRANSRLLYNFFDDLEELEKPVIAAINGACLGGGLELALACDMRIAAQSATLGFPGGLGVLPRSGCARLVRVIGYAKTKELVFTCKIISAEEAEKIGLVNWVVPDEKLLDEAGAFAKELLQKAPQALGLAKRVIGECAHLDLRAGSLLGSLAQSVLIKTADHKEGVRAFREKRKPRFTGK